MMGSNVTTQSDSASVASVQHPLEDERQLFRQLGNGVLSRHNGFELVDGMVMIKRLHGSAECHKSPVPSIHPTPHAPKCLLKPNGMGFFFGQARPPV